MAERAGDAGRYTAFLSYSHKDSAAAGKLHRRLESYRMPKRLAGSETGRGRVPERLWPIFRDRDELPAATDLSETVREALAESGSLIVLCSPNSAASLWVAEEIETFRALHPDRPILAAIVEGEPPDCFPAPLRAKASQGAMHEPLATDLRPNGDGARLGLLKLVAGITGVGLDALVQRDAARRVRRVTAITAAAVVAMLVMAAMTWFALDARREAERQRIEAEHQRSEAEGLVEFMLTDLRERLRPVGSLDAMGAVNARALSYYGSRRDLRHLSTESLARRARILQAIGDDDIVRKDWNSAFRAFREARQTTAEQLARAPNDSKRLFEHAKSEVGIGRVYEGLENWRMAERHYTAFAAAADRLVATAPGNPDYLTKAASSAVDLGNVQLKGSRDYPAAERSYRRALARFEQAAQSRPGDVHLRLAQANAYAGLADSYFVRSLWRQSLDARRSQYSILTTLQGGHPRDTDIAFRMAAGQRGLVYSLLRTGDRAGARVQLFPAYLLASRLVRRDVENAEWRTLRDLLGYDLLHLGLGVPPGVTLGELQKNEKLRSVAYTREHGLNLSRH
jgi:tetratricopeptide (TPR) repeat protein